MPRNRLAGLIWTEDRIEQLKKLWENGLSASQIASELGNVTRNAVIGKVARLGLSGRKQARLPAPPRQHKARRKPKYVEVACAVAPEAIAEFDAEVPLSQRRTMLELNKSTCHWPVGDPGSEEFFFCGGNALEKLPYCAQHSRIAYQAGTARKRPSPFPNR